MKSKVPQVIMLEFNELTPSLMDRFIAEGHLPNFKRLKNESHIYVTDAEEEGDNLQPWVQWVSAHTGLSAADYGVTRLSDGHKLQEKAIWDLISEAGHKVWVCGSMNARYDQPLNGYLLPDPWSTGLKPYPEEEMRPYYDFVSRAVQEHTNEPVGRSRALNLSFLRFMIAHGLSVRTVLGIIKQLFTERWTKKFKWRRAAILDRLQWDIFRYYYRKVRPQLSTFFINSTAHYQHSHWREMEPAVFELAPDSAHLADFKEAILFGYKQMDRLVGRFLSLAGREAILVFCTGLSQQPFTSADTSGGRHFYRLRTSTVLQSQLGLQTPHEYFPVMAEQFTLRFQDELAAEDAKEHLLKFRIGLRTAFHIVRQESDLMVQCTQTQAVPETTELWNEKTDQKLPFYDIFYQLDNLQSGRHHPDGMLWIRYLDRRHQVHEEKPSIRSIAPTILDFFGLCKPDYMSCDSVALNSLTAASFTKSATMV